MPDNVIEPMAYSITETMVVLSLGRSSVYGLIKSGALVISKIGDRTLVHRSSIEKLLKDTIVSTDH
jgi:hypothetical protein